MLKHTVPWLWPCSMTEERLLGTVKGEHACALQDTCLCCKALSCAPNNKSDLAVTLCSDSPSLQGLWCQPPDVWFQLLCRLQSDGAACQSVQQAQHCSSTWLRWQRI